MARQVKHGLLYFPLDVDMFEDIRIRKLIKYHDGKAVVVYLALLCIIYKRGYFIEWDSDMSFVVSEKTGLDEAYINEVVEYCLNIGLFDKHLFDTEHILTSAAVQRRYIDVFSMMRRKIVINRFSLLSCAEIPNSCTTNTDKCTRIDKNAQETPQNVFLSGERKEKEKKENIIDDDVNNAREEDFDFVKNKKTKIKKESSCGAVAVADVAPAVAVAPVPVQRGVYGVSRCKPVADLVAECKASTEWVESVCMSTGLSQADVLTRLDGFPAHLTANGYDGDKSMDDFKRHFFNFIKKQQANGNHQQATTGRAGVLCPADGRYYAKPNPDDIYAEHRRRYGLQ